MTLRSTGRMLVALATALILALGVTSLPAEAAGKKKTKGSVAWITDTWVSGSGTGYALQGSLNSNQKRKVLLQYKTPTGWLKLDSTKARKGVFSMSGTWDWYGAHKVRVLVPATRKYKKKTFGHTVTVQSGYEARGLAEDYRLMKYRGKRIRMNPCQTVKYRINTDQIGPAVEPLIHSAVGMFSRASGIKFKFVGRSKKIGIASRRLEKGTDLLIGWGNESQVPSLRGTVARGGPVYIVPGRDKKGRIWKAPQSSVTVNLNTTAPGPGQAVDLTMDSQSRATLGMTLLHEMGHAFGLHHNSQGEEGRVQIMYWSTNVLPWSDGWFRSLFGAGDLTGLAKVGMAAGCVK